MSRCCIALGGNTGDPATSFERALSKLHGRGITVVEASATIATPAMGASAGPEFLNAAAVLETDITAQALLEQLHQVEADLGRERRIHWGPRPIDLDLLFFEQQIIRTDTLVVPHPALWYRHFVLTPLSEIAPHWTHPELGESVLQLQQRLQRRPLRLEVPSDIQCTREDLRTRTRAADEPESFEFLTVSRDSAVQAETFARLVEVSATANQVQTTKQGRIIPVPIREDQNDPTGDWKEFLDVLRAAIGT